MTREEIIALAKRHGASAYTSRHYPDETYVTFPPGKLEAFFHAAQQMKPPTPVSTVDFLPHDNYLRFAQRVLEGDAPESDRKEAARMICDIRRALYIQRGQQAPIEEPELPEAVAYINYKVDCSPEPPYEEVRREKELGFKKLSYGYAVRDAESFYTAAQMHEHFQAGVRAGMARGQTLQALQRGFEKVLADPEKHGLDLG